jgi:hypothetical protein
MKLPTMAQTMTEHFLRLCQLMDKFWQRPMVDQEN